MCFISLKKIWTQILSRQIHGTQLVILTQLLRQKHYFLTFKLMLLKDNLCWSRRKNLTQ